MIQLKQLIAETKNIKTFSISTTDRYEYKKENNKWYTKLKTNNKWLDMKQKLSTANYEKAIKTLSNYINDTNTKTDIDNPQSTIKAKSSDIKSTNSNSAISAGGTTVVIGGMSYATSKWMRSQWEKAGLPTANVEFINYTEESKLKQIKATKNVTKIMGFSAGGLLVWKEIDSNPKKYNFIGLIDPTTRKVYSSLPNNVYSMSNSGNWGTYPKIKSNLATMEKSGVLNKTSQPHINIPYEFFVKYKDKLK